MLNDVCSDMKKNVRKLEHANEILKCEKFQVDEKALGLYEDVDKLNETLNMKEEVFNTNLSKLKSESLQLKQKIESLICENHQLLERLKKAESDLTINRHWNSSSGVLKSHHNRNKEGLGFVTKRTVYPVNRKYVGLPESIICFHSIKTGHYRYACPLRKHPIERNLIHVKQIWVMRFACLREWDPSGSGFPN